MLPHLTSTLDGVRVSVRVKLFSQKSAVLSARGDGSLEVALAVKPKGGEANAELCRCLSFFFDLPRSNVVIESGHKSRSKTVLLRDAYLGDVEAKLTNGCEEEEKEAKSVSQG